MLTTKKLTAAATLLALGVIVFAVVLVTLGKYLLPAKPIVTRCEVEKP